MTAHWITGHRYLTIGYFHLISAISIYQLGYARFDWFRSSRCETIFTSEIVDNDTETKWGTKEVASRPFRITILKKLQRSPSRR